MPSPPPALIPVRTDTREPGAAPVAPELVRVRPAAVLVLVYPAPTGGPLVLLTERVDRGGHHSGEVSFPGGSAEPHDDGPVATAIREAAEEVGLDADAVGLRVAGLLESFWIPVSGFRVSPVVALADRRPADLRPQPTEVARIVEAPLAAFLPGAPIEIVERDVRGWRLRYGAYPVDGLLVWGATARVLGQLGALVASR
ncbi:MAG TPA: CoA pyrophosphatase [Candidatus Limnocylindrales bacterium]|nr:CoA pyrophosphatase [Candidatus Limnocylindrales bacterium]